ncbi:hypothetical protein K443DRAFT_683273 [Laccaria amethystina LaAM-08-1]|uniref:Pseudouridine synthase RsuA/RluA-like domain-containing protein n=1 Tax=Laccaria amethystina LaAM-08-1 TaxID=1095629 RepID=A0A0C9XBH8_9AGAR|nr:hypothetical protein K443DRAFT_683273 [Laccaria amethystina LaAM-08-1]
MAKPGTTTEYFLLTFSFSCSWMSNSTTRLSQVKRSTKFHFQITHFSPQDQFRQNIINLIRSSFMPTTDSSPIPQPPGLKKIAPYWFPYTTMTKMRWIGRELLEVVSTEFRDRSMEYYRYALESGVTTVNGQIAKPDTKLRDGDRIENVVHRHEPPVTSTPVKVLYHDMEREFLVVDKPGSIPVHASGRYYRNTLIEILVNDFGYKKCYPANRLDRLTSGLMIIPLSPDRARALTDEFMTGTVRKEYVARVRGRFPAEEIVCEQPLLTVDRQMGLNVVHPEGKPAKTVFNLIRYDENTDSSVVRCEPLTGRSHQLRVHLQYLGFPIANDPIYSESRIWGENIGKGGMDTVPSDERAAPAPPPHLEELTKIVGSPESLRTHKDGKTNNKLLPRETGEDIGMGSPVPLSSEAVGVITRLRNMKDEDEDWSRWRDVVFRAKGALGPHNLVIKPPPPQNRRRRGGNGELMVRDIPAATLKEGGVEGEGKGTSSSSSVEPQGESTQSQGEGESSTDSPSQLTTAEVLSKISSMEPAGDVNTVIQSDNLYCPECYLPLHPDPKPEKLYIFLHARKYTTSFGAFETDMPEWAAEGWVWDQS